MDFGAGVRYNTPGVCGRHDQPQQQVRPEFPPDYAQSKEHYRCDDTGEFKAPAQPTGCLLPLGLNMRPKRPGADDTRQSLADASP